MQKWLQYAMQLEEELYLEEATLYCTTYPCHMCAKLILAVGIKRVVYIDPYPKSKAIELFGECIKDTLDKCDESNCLVFDAFMGIAPRRYLYVFEQNNRKEKDKIHAKKAQRNNDSPYLKGRNRINYLLREICVLRKLKKNLEKKTNLNKELQETINGKRTYLEKIRIDKNLNEIIEGLELLMDDYESEME